VLVVGTWALTDLSPANSGESLIKSGDRVVLLGGTLAERFQYSGWLETRLQFANPGSQITVRNLGWSGDEVGLMPRPLNFGELEDHLGAQKADVILLCFGANESFGGEEKLAIFENDLASLIDRLQAKPFHGGETARLVLVSPTAHEQLGPPWPDAGPRNAVLSIYTKAMKKVAEERDLPFIDLFHPTRSLMAENGSGQPLTINGIHFTDEGCRIVSEVLAIGLGFTDPLPGESEPVREIVIEKNRQFFLRWRPVNAEYIFGRRNKPFGVMSYPPEMAQLDRQIEELDQKIHEAVVTLTPKTGGKP